MACGTPKLFLQQHVLPIFTQEPIGDGHPGILIIKKRQVVHTRPASILPTAVRVIKGRQGPDGEK